MRQFNTPPGWPDPPNARWRPPKRWGPAEAWPPAPDGWRFWVDEDGRPVRGPIGRYGGPSIVKLASIATVVVALIGLVLFNPFAGGGDPETTAAPTTTETTPVEGTTIAPETEAPTPAGATAPTTEPTTEPTAEPTTTPQETEPTTSASSTPKSTSTPTEPTSAPTTTSTGVVFRNCAEVRAAGKAPLHRGDPGYSAELDNNGDGTACERGNS